MLRSSFPAGVPLLGSDSEFTIPSVTREEHLSYFDHAARLVLSVKLAISPVPEAARQS
jgi:hypothetical protein